MVRWVDDAGLCWALGSSLAIGKLKSALPGARLTWISVSSECHDRSVYESGRGEREGGGGGEEERGGEREGET